MYGYLLTFLVHCNLACAVNVVKRLRERTGVLPSFITLVDKDVRPFLDRHAANKFLGPQ